MILTINHTSTYRYSAPVNYGLQQLRLTPKARKSQKILAWQVDVTGGEKQLQFHDQHENIVDLIRISPGSSEVTVHCHGQVEVQNTHGVVGQQAGHVPLWLFQRPTALTLPGEGITAMAREVEPEIGDPVSMLHSLSEHIRGVVAYATGATDADTSAEQAITIGKGVCQDHAHIFIGTARLLGIPARYVSGYLMMNDRIEQEATHGWAEAHVPDLGWVGFDVSNGYSPDDRYVRVATGLDYREAAPVSGMRMGSSDEQMLVSIQVQQ